MVTRIQRPQRVSPHELDEVLARGWYRIAQTLMTCRFVVYDGVLRSAVWTRVPLDRYRFRKSLRKLMAKNAKRFTTTVQPATTDPARQDLYARYCETAKGDRPETLEQFLYGESDVDAFDTWEIGIWDDDRLVAFSLFDRGVVAIQSLIGVYDPDYHRHSLGFYTILLEMQYAIDEGYRYHYTGYVLPGEPAMDYKLRVGGLEYFEPDTGQWLPWDDLEDADLPTRKMRRALSRACRALRELDIKAAIRVYPAFELSAYDPALAYCLDQPMFVECFSKRRGDEALVITYDIESGDYQLTRCLRAIARSREPVEGSREFALLVVYETVARHDSPAMIATLAAGQGPP